MDLSSFDYDNDTIYYKYDSSTNRIVIYDIDMDKENINTINPIIIEMHRPNPHIAHIVSQTAEFIFLLLV